MGSHRKAMHLIKVLFEGIMDLCSDWAVIKLYPRICFLISCNHMMITNEPGSMQEMLKWSWIKMDAFTVIYLIVFD